ncbi:VWA domain-containing protein [Rubrivirga litoralis]|uniref:VWA domain-containing protein n=1 Tax=Rubrivirga litoralis TaxID=3075598 RepID=A0ABU3BSX5_9BACT|nr:VWA domain-containing protein [Rubrivirga sp. F394]MDT0632399.1 VWA domain-containing protein [Rubrivirga sp. F394]
MSFRDPLVLGLVAVLVGAALVAFAHAARRRAEALRLFLGARAGREESGLAPVVRRRRVRAGLVAGALACLGLALAGPRAGTSVREARQESLDLLVALDVSESMRAEDVAPSRLDRAKLAVERVVADRQGDRVGLVVFAGEAFLQCPLTTDRGALRLFLDAADPEMVGAQGTDFASALRVADRAFDAAAEGADARPRALLVVSDGEDHEGGLGGAADALRDDGVTILALGVGTEEGAAVPEVRRGRVVGVHRDRSGAEVVSRYEPGALRDLAGRGDVVRVGQGGAAAAEVNALLDGLDRAVLTESEVAASAERFQWPLALGLLLLLVERLLALRPAPPDDDAGGVSAPRREAATA